jgi:FtsZ-interacting cell division protein ZipA
MDVALIVIVAVAAIAVVALLVALSRRSKVAHRERKREVGEARDVAREQNRRAELSEAEKHRARADVATERAERERLAAELHETRAGNGNGAAAERPAEEPVRDDDVARSER